jgi:hypothetical protein
MNGLNNICLIGLKWVGYSAPVVEFNYTNAQGEVERRRVIFFRLEWGVNEEFHTPQWLIIGNDQDRNEICTLAMSNIEFKAA